LQQQQTIERLQQEIERLKVSLQDSQNSSKPPSSDLLKKPENRKCQKTKQPSPSGNQEGKRVILARLALVFGRVDRVANPPPPECSHCGSHDFVEQPVGLQRQQVAQLVASPIEVVNRHTYRVPIVTHMAAWPASIVPGQDLSVELQAMLVWLGNYGHPH